MIKIKFLLFVFVLFPVSVWGRGNLEVVAPINNRADCVRFPKGVDRDECIELVNDQQEREDQKWLYENQDPQPNCFSNLSNNFKGGLDRDYQFEQDRARQLMEAAEKRAETLKNCRQELRKTWIDFQNKKAEQAKQRALYPVKLRQAELNYQKELNRIQRQCREKGNADYVKYREIIEARGALGPDQLHGFGNRINKHRRHFFQSCYQGEDNVNAMKVADRQLALNIDRARAEMRSVDEMVQSFEEQTELVQEDILRDCEKQKELNKYNETLAGRLAAKGNTNNKYHTTLNFSSSILGCMGSGGGGGLSPLNPLGSSSAR